MAQLLQWTEIAGDFADSLLLGNGASIAIDPCFSYRSLLRNARESGLISPGAQQVFARLDTNDFELALSNVAQAREVNRALGINEVTTERAYRDIRDSLVKAVRQHHASYEAVRPHLPSIHGFMKRFDTVVSLNYDLIVYWALLEGNRVYGRWFKDCFPHQKFDRDWHRFRKPLGANGATLVFYPHGSLALAASLGGVERKIVKPPTADTFLEYIVATWNGGLAVPLFVSEGESSQKERAIRRSPYLSTVYDTVLPQLGPSLVIYGWSMQANDQHVLRQVCKGGNIRRIAVSVYRGNRDRLQVARDCDFISWRVRSVNREVALCFFDAASPGCWIHPDNDAACEYETAA